MPGNDDNHRASLHRVAMAGVELVNLMGLGREPHMTMHIVSLNM